MVVLYDCDIVGLPNRLQRFAVIASISLPLAVMLGRTLGSARV